MKYELSIAILTLSAALQNAVASSLTVEMTATEITHEFYGNYSVDHLAGSYYGATDWPTFNVSLSSVDSLILRLSAPKGSVFQVDALSNSIGRAFSAGGTGWSSLGSSSTGPAKFLPTVLTLENSIGALPPQTGSFFKVSADRGRITSDGSNLSYGNLGKLTFSAMVFTVDTSALRFENIASKTYSSNRFGAYIQEIYGVQYAYDPGPALRLVSSIPEPSSIFMFLSGAAVLLLALRHRSRESNSD